MWIWIIVGVLIIYCLLNLRQWIDLLAKQRNNSTLKHSTSSSTITPTLSKSKIQIRDSLNNDGVAIHSNNQQQQQQQNYFNNNNRNLNKRSPSNELRQRQNIYAPSEDNLFQSNESIIRNNNNQFDSTTNQRSSLNNNKKPTQQTQQSSQSQQQQQTQSRDEFTSTGGRFSPTPQNNSLFSNEQQTPQNTMIAITSMNSNANILNSEISSARSSAASSPTEFALINKLQ